MASGHGFSVLANSSLRRPVNPKTGFASTSFDPKDLSRDDDVASGSDEEEYEARAIDASAGLQNADLDPATDADFYRKLVDLKEAHKKTLAMWERMYVETHPHEQPPDNLTRSRLASLENLLNSDRSGHEKHEVSGGYVRDRVADMSAAKPPPGKPHQSAGFPAKSSSIMDPHSLSYRSSMSGDFHSDREITDNDDDGKDRRHRVDVDTRQNAMEQIGDMWDTFSIDKYCPRSRTRSGTHPGLFRSSSMSRISMVDRDPKKPNTASSVWKKKATVPEPFSMSVREAVKTPKKSRAAIELEMREEERKRAEELECQKKFKAAPLPAHVHLRLYEEIREAQETRRRNVVQNRQELLQSMQQPFQFTLRDDDMKKQRPSTAPSKKSSTFKAHPFPTHIFEDSAVEKILEEEEYRKIRMRMRAKELLRSASLPPTMKVRGKEYTEGRERRQVYAERVRRAGFVADVENHRFKPRINETVPDYDRQYDRFMREMSRQKTLKDSTVCRPFNLRTSAKDFGKRRSVNVKGRANRSLADLSDGAGEISQENRRPLQMSMSTSFTGSYSEPFDVIPSKTTQAAVLRTSATRLRMQKQLEKEEMERRKQVDHRGKEKQLKKSIVEKSVPMDSGTVQSVIKEKLKEKRRADREKAENYKQQLDEMNRRVQERPLLFEQTAQRNARQAAERRYLATLSKSGIDVNFLDKTSAGATAAGSVVDDTFLVGSGRASPGRWDSPQHGNSPTGTRSPFGRNTPERDVGSLADQRRSASLRSGGGSPSAEVYTQDYEDDDRSEGSIVEESEELEAELA